MEITSRPQERESHNSPIPSPRSDNPTQTPPPYPTTFVQADTSTFKHVVQMLTGSSPKPASSQPDPITATSKPHPPIRSAGVKKQQGGGYKQLYERRNSLKNGLMINPAAAGIVPRGPPQEILSPSMLNFPSLALSPVTPLIEDPFDRAEERAIAEKGFYLHPSPRTTTPGSEPRLLSLFPVTSPRVAESSSN